MDDPSIFLVCDMRSEDCNRNLWTKCPQLIIGSSPPIVHAWEISWLNVYPIISSQPNVCQPNIHRLQTSSSRFHEFRVFYVLIILYLKFNQCKIYNWVVYMKRFLCFQFLMLIKPKMLSRPWLYPWIWSIFQDIWAKI